MADDVWTIAEEELNFEKEHDKKRIHINAQYTNDPKYDYSLSLQIINLDKEMMKDISTGKGFVVAPPNNIKKDVKDPNGIFSPRFGQTLGDQEPFKQQYRCKCGLLQGAYYKNQICPSCHTKVHRVVDNYDYYGYIYLRNYTVIHPNLYSQIEYLCGPGKSPDKERHSKLYNMLKYAAKTDENGHIVMDTPNYPDQPFYGIGMIDFVKRFDEIMKYYVDKYPKKIDTYNNIMKNRGAVFTHAIPVFTTLLRPFDIQHGSMRYEKTSAMFTMMTYLASHINKNDTSMARNKKQKNNLLFDFQTQVQLLYDEIIRIMSGKKGDLRQLIGGRFNFAGRSVIVQDPKLRIDQIKLPYAALVIMLQQKICNILRRTYNISESDAYNIWRRATDKPDPQIKKIIMSIIKSHREGIPMLLNRNPTIAYGSILQVFCVGINDNYTISIPLQVLRLFAADFDGDVLNVVMIINDVFFMQCYRVFNPRNAMYISRNDGLFNISAGVERDSIINANTLMNMGRTEIDQNFNVVRIDKIKQILAHNNDVDIAMAS